MSVFDAGSHLYSAHLAWTLLFRSPSIAPGVSRVYQERDLIWLLLQALAIALPAFLLLTGRAARLREACAKLARGARLSNAAPVRRRLSDARRRSSSCPSPIGSRWRIGLRGSSPQAVLANGSRGRAGILAAQVIGAALLIWIPFALIRRTPRWWWLGTATIAWLLVSALLITEQVWIRPMTTQIVPLPEGPLKTKFDAIAARCGSDGVPVYIGGHDNTVVGAGRTRHILISKHEIDHAPTAENEVVSTFAHRAQALSFRRSGAGARRGGRAFPRRRTRSSRSRRGCDQALGRALRLRLARGSRGASVDDGNPRPVLGVRRATPIGCKTWR